MPVTSVSGSTVAKDLNSINKYCSNHVKRRAVVDEKGSVSRAEVEESGTTPPDSKCRDGSIINVEAYVANLWSHTVESVGH